MALVLIIEDEHVLARNIKAFLEHKGHQAETAGTVAQGLEKYAALHPDVILLDYNLPDGTGTEIITAVRRRDPSTKLVMLTAHGGVEVAVAAMKAGADDYLTKPLSLDEIEVQVARLLAQSRMQDSLSYFQARRKPAGGVDSLLGESTEMQDLRRRILQVANAERAAAGQAGPPVLVLGETGTGKELIARALHFEGGRAGQPFVEVNCAALPDQLVESELFGHERGAFTGASERKPGLFQAADGGTLFLDEVGELPLQQQAKLLKAIEEKVVRPVGSVRDRRVDVRIIAATNASLDERVRQGEFRADLLYRLNTLTLVSPPLRRRGDDVLLLARAFIAEFQGRYGRSGLALDAGAGRALLAHPWPGNVRELRNVIEQACLMCAGDVIATADLNLRDLPPIAAAGAAGGGGLIDVEKSLIVEALRQHSGNVTFAARQLRISRDTLRYRMEKFALRREDYL